MRGKHFGNAVVNRHAPFWNELIAKVLDIATVATIENGGRRRIGVLLAWQASERILEHSDLALTLVDNKRVIAGQLAEHIGTSLTVETKDAGHVGKRGGILVRDEIAKRGVIATSSQNEIRSSKVRTRPIVDRQRQRGGVLRPRHIGAETQNLVNYCRVACDYFTSIGCPRLSVVLT